MNSEKIKKMWGRDMSREISMESREIIESLLHQFAYDNEHGAIGTGGLSALEAAFDYMGWEDPHPLEEELICNNESCEKTATCGTPTPEGYQRLCYDHYVAVAPSHNRGDK